MKKLISKIMVANRGEIAVRVMRTARSLGYRTVAIFSDVDAGSLHVRMADEAVHIGGSAAADSYLSIAKVMAAAKQTGTDAIHPGYGFLSENADFSAACDEAGIIFIGPPSPAMTLMASKRLAKIAMIEAGVPCVPGYEGPDQSDANLAAEAARIGVPLMVKASAGGGGKGMRLVNDMALLGESIARARSEAKKAFGFDELILERAIIEPRHIEIQVFGDSHGNVIHLGERDCSIQRRHQKVIEESPSPFVKPELRAAMGMAAVRAAASCGYQGAGTVEFLVDQQENFYFLEMNTRLQVEHPVTEMVTGLDLVEWQIRVAAGEALPLTQDAVMMRGHAIEARLYAEDPRRDFAPQTGTVSRWQLPAGEGLRIDTGIAPGQAVTAFYDPMIAKVIAYGADRELAARRLARAIEDIRLFGVITNRRFLASILRHPAFLAGEATTAFIATHYAGDPMLTYAPPEPLAWQLAAAIFCLANERQNEAWRNGDIQLTRLVLQSDQERRVLTVEPRSGGLSITMGEYHALLRITQTAETAAVFEISGWQRRVDWLRKDGDLVLDFGAGESVFSDVTLAPPSRTAAAGDGVLIAPMDGLILAVLREPGERVRKGDAVVTLEAMKMESQITASINGVLKSVNVKINDQVKSRQILAIVERDDD